MRTICEAAMQSSICETTMQSTIKPCNRGECNGQWIQGLLASQRMPWRCLRDRRPANREAGKSAEGAWASSLMRLGASIHQSSVVARTSRKTEIPKMRSSIAALIARDWSCGSRSASHGRRTIIVSGVAASHALSSRAWTHLTRLPRVTHEEVPLHSRR